MDVTFKLQPSRKSHSSMILLPVVDQDVLIFDLNTVKQLREKGILGKFTGTLATEPQQNNFLGLPLILTLFEIIYLVEHNHAKLIDGTILPLPQVMSPDRYKMINKNKDGPYYTTNYGYKPEQLSEVEVSLEVFKNQVNLDDYKVFKYLKNKGYWLLPGLKFGGKFVAYPGDPMLFHSHLIVEPLKTLNCLDLVVSGRLASGVKKLYVIADFNDIEIPNNDDGNIEQQEDDTEGKIYSIEWAGFG